jgi:hypothetical protein
MSLGPFYSIGPPFAAFDSDESYFRADSGSALLGNNRLNAWQEIVELGWGANGDSPWVGVSPWSGYAQGSSTGSGTYEITYRSQWYFLPVIFTDAAYAAGDYANPWLISVCKGCVSETDATPEAQSVVFIRNGYPAHVTYNLRLITTTHTYYNDGTGLHFGYITSESNSDSTSVISPDNITSNAVTCPANEVPPSSPSVGDNYLTYQLVIHGINIPSV